ncbi:MAG: NAD(P)/FAD-dependent oxidoreductase, partial [Oscillospiraceae bacterium]|nr:NAD(P)/FAD-dependent oxidoreductase [Oscillospiraceae bacterium]
LVQKSLARFVLKTANIQAAYPCAQLTDKQLVSVSEALHGLRFPVTGTGDFTQAQATAGGVHGKALDAGLGVKGYPGLYVTGEVVDVHADCGGYHLHWCWASGVAAARRVAAAKTL